jgi:flagellar L-ring protein precursor FlgH
MKVLRSVTCSVWLLAAIPAMQSQTASAPALTAAPAPAQNSGSSLTDKLKLKKAPVDLRADYLQRLHEQYMPPPSARTTGSLWSSANSLGDLASDYKARNVNDTIVVSVSVQTTAAQSGTLDSERTMATSSGITGLAGDLATKGVSSLFNANSSTVLKGQGSTGSNTTFTTSLTGQVIAVLANGNMVIEAERQIAMNNQHENVIIRGIVRPGDISPANTVTSAQLSNLEIEMKGKGIISDSVRPPNPITRAILWLFGF